MLKLEVLAAILLPICQSYDVVVNCDEPDGAILSRQYSLVRDPELVIAGDAVNVDCRPALPLMCTNTRSCDVSRKNFWAKKVCLGQDAECP